MKFNRIMKIIIGWFFTFIFLYFSLKKLNLNDILTSLETADKNLLALACLFFILGYACRIERWRSMLTHENNMLSFYTCSWPLIISVATNNVWPLRAGDVIRMFAFNNKLNISATLSVSSLLVERILDLTVILIFLLAASYYFNIGSIKEFSYTIFIIPFFLLLIFTSYILLKSKRSLINTIINLIYPKFPKIVEFFNEKLKSVYLFIDHVSSKLVIFKIIFLSFMAWLFEGLVFYCVAISLPNINFPVASWLALSIGTLSTMIPSSPGFIGTFDYFVSFAMKELDNNQLASVTYAILLHFILWSLPIVASMIYYLIGAFKRN